MESSAWKVTPSVNAVLGATYAITDHLLFGAEITPGIAYSYGKTKTTTNSQNLESTNTSYSFGFNSNSSKLTLAYSFGK